MINDFKDLEKFLKILRKQGITEASFGDLTVKLGDLPMEQSAITEAKGDFYSEFPQGELTPEQLMYYSAGGMPENDPYIKGGQ